MKYIKEFHNYYDTPERNMYYMWNNGENMTTGKYKDFKKWLRFHNLNFKELDKEILVKVKNKKQYAKMKGLFGGNLLMYKMPNNTPNDYNIRVTGGL